MLDPHDDYIFESDGIEEIVYREVDNQLHVFAGGGRRLYGDPASPDGTIKRYLAADLPSRDESELENMGFRSVRVGPLSAEPCAGFMKTVVIEIPVAVWKVLWLSFSR